MKGLGIYAMVAVAIGGIYFYMKRGSMTITPNPVKQGSTFGVRVTGLTPGQTIIWGWEAFPGTQQTSIVTSTGAFFWPDMVLSTTAIGNYTLFVQVQGGKRVTGTLKVIAA